MSHHGHHPEKHSHAPDTSAGYERTDAAAKPVVVFIFWLTVFTLVSFALCLGMYRLLEMGQASLDPGIHPMAQERKLTPGVPRLQVREAADMAAYRKASEEKVNGYGWISREASVVRVPADKAIDLILKNKELKSRE